MELNVVICSPDPPGTQIQCFLTGTAKNQKMEVRGLKTERNMAEGNTKRVTKILMILDSMIPQRISGAKHIPKGLPSSGLGWGEGGSGWRMWGRGGVCCHPQSPSLMRKNNGRAWGSFSQRETAGRQSCSLCTSAFRGEGAIHSIPATHHWAVYTRLWTRQRLSESLKK